MPLTFENSYQDAEISASMLRIILESGNIGYFIWDIKNRTIQYNQKWFELNNFDMPQTSSSLKSLFKIMTQKNRKLLINKLRKILNNTEKKFKIDTKLINKKSKQIWCRINGQLLKLDADGKPGVFVGTLQNINEKKKLIEGYRELNDKLVISKNKLEANSQTLKTLNKIVPGMMFKFRYSLQGEVEFEYVSDGIKNLFEADHDKRYSFEELTEKMSDSQKEKLKIELDKKVPKLKDIKFDGRFQLKSKSKWIHIHAVFDEIGDDYLSYAGIAYDNTDTMKLIKEVQNNNKKLTILNDKLKYDNHKLKYIFDNINTLVIIWSGFGIISYANSYTKEVFQYTEEEFINRSWMDLIVPSKEKTGVDTKKLLEEVIANPDNFAVNHNFNSDKNGKLFYVNWSNLSYSDYNGIKHVLSIGNILESYSTQKELTT